MLLLLQLISDYVASLSLPQQNIYTVLHTYLYVYIQLNMYIYVCERFGLYASTKFESNPLLAQFILLLPLHHFSPPWSSTGMCYRVQGMITRDYRVCRMRFTGPNTSSSRPNAISLCYTHTWPFPFKLNWPFSGDSKLEPRLVRCHACRHEEKVYELRKVLPNTFLKVEPR